MKANELRIGNLVSFESENYSISVISKAVVQFEPKEIYSPISGMVFKLKEIQGIPLSEEILLKCGFEKVKNRDGVRACYRIKTILITLSNSGNWYFNQRIIHLHDLQNIVHANIGQELNTSGL